MDALSRVASQTAGSLSLPLPCCLPLNFLLLLPCLPLPGARQGLNPEFEQGRVQGLGLGAKFLPHHKVGAGPQRSAARRSVKLRVAGWWQGMLCIGIAAPPLAAAVLSAALLPAVLTASCCRLHLVTIRPPLPAHPAARRWH